MILSSYRVLLANYAIFDINQRFLLVIFFINYIPKLHKRLLNFLKEQS